MNKKPKVFKRKDWASSDRPWHGSLEGQDIGANVTVLFYSTDKVGVGPRWHVHPYDEVFIVRQGRALFTVGEHKLEAETGDVVLGPANIPHKFRNLGPGSLETTDIHLSDRWIQTNLDDPDANA